MSVNDLSEPDGPQSRRWRVGQCYFDGAEPGAWVVEKVDEGPNPSILIYNAFLAERRRVPLGDAFLNNFTEVKK